MADETVPEQTAFGKPKRKSLSKKIRFEVFKRDKFTCQYCGRTAPEVVLQCDHIAPVAKGGKNDILNLITSCFDCNNGKRDVPLADGQTLKKQIEMLSDLEEKRQQIEMMMRWRDELESLDDYQVDKAAQSLEIDGLCASEFGRSKIKKMLKKYSLEEFLIARDEAFEKYYDCSREGWGAAFNKIESFMKMRRVDRDKPWMRQVFYIQGILRNRTGATGTAPFIEFLHLNGWDLDLVETFAKGCDRITSFTGPYQAALRENGTPWLDGRPYR
ncbi:MAG: HNH endonuclease [Acetobacter indonesiensis]|jgi:hypothetical protein|nr:HNH endonuclease [Acetobacter indonesiensis]MCI1546154.1 HNH endonuclease [Acetobacter indonesiensis]MCI1765600.1 HNH endonuclease [Acetobacter indonesiensis]